MNTRLDRYVPGGAAKFNFTVDAMLLGLALWLARGARLAALDGHQLALFAVGLMIWFVATAVLRLYAPYTPRRLLDAILLNALAVATPTLGLGLLSYWGEPTQVFAPLTFATTLFVGSQLNHHVLGRVLAHRLPAQIDNVLILGTGALGLATYEHLYRDPRRRVLGFLHFTGEPDAVPFRGVPVLGGQTLLLQVLSAHAVDELYIAGRIRYQAREMQQAVQTCELVGMPFALPLHTLHFDRAMLLSSSPRRDGYLHYQNSAPRPVAHAIKRLIDILAAALALGMLSPLLAAVVIAIRAESRGPVLFRQPRVGLHGTPFNMLKFRSMVVDAEARRAELAAHNEQTGPVFKMARDPRVTRVGRFIRKYSIDELPQLVNVLRGDMTLVGPRPALASEVAQYKAWQRRRLSVRPGLTCYWQISGRNQISFEEWMRLDLRYVDNWDLWVDLRMIIQTFPAVLAGRGAS